MWTAVLIVFPASPALLRALGLERTIISFSNIYNYTSSLAGRSYLNREGWEEVKEERGFERPKLSKDDVEVGEGSERLEGRRWWGEGTKKRVIGAWSRSYGLPLLSPPELGSYITTDSGALVKSLNPSEPQFPHLKNGDDNDHTSLKSLAEGLVRDDDL